MHLGHGKAVQCNPLSCCASACSTIALFVAHTVWHVCVHALPLLPAVLQSQPGGSAFLVLMQQYTRLVLLAVEVVAAAGLPTVRPLHPPETVRAPSGYSAAFTTSCSVPLDMLPGSRGDGGEGAAGQGQLGPEQCPPRGLAVRLMMAFTGAVLGSQWSLKKFVEGVRVAYAQVRWCSRQGQ